MRHFLIAGTILFAVAAPDSANAQERQYPWCARYDWTTYNCGFVSFGQCMATVQGAGGLSAAMSELEGRYAWNWAKNVWGDMLG